MTIVYVNWPGLIIALVTLLLLGVAFLAFPVSVWKFMLNWPKLVTFGLIRDEDYSPKSREAKKLIDNDPEEFAHRFSDWILMSMIVGGGCLLLFVLTLFLVLASLLSNARSGG